MLATTYDKNGRVNLSTTQAGTSFAWYKDNLLFATTASGVLADNQPRKNYQRVTYVPGGDTNIVSFSFTGVEFGIYATPEASLALTIVIDGGSPIYYTVHAGSNRFSGSNQLIWGKSGLTNVAHTVVITKTAGAGYLSSLFKSHVYSNRSISFGQAITYKVIVDGTIEETSNVTPVVSRVDAMQSLLDRVITGGSLASFPANIPYPSLYDTSEFMGSVAGAYYLLGDSRLPAIANLIYTEHLARTDTNGVFHWDGAEVNTEYYQIVTNGRIASNYWFAHKAFKDDYPVAAANYLEVADKITDTFLSGWYKNGSNQLGYLFANMAFDSEEGPWTEYSTIGAPGNQYATAVYGMALLYNEPASRHYLSPSLYTLLIANANVALTNSPINATTGAMSYYGAASIEDMLYAFITWQCFKYLSDKFGWHTADVAKCTAWLNSLPITEPYFYRSEFYWGCQPGIAFIRAQTEYAQYGGVSQDFVDLFFSSAFDNSAPDLNDSTNDGSNPDYKPEGFDLSSAGLVDIQTGVASIFWTAQTLIAIDGLSSDVDTWYMLEATTPPPTTAPPTTAPPTTAPPTTAPPTTSSAGPTSPILTFKTSEGDIEFSETHGGALQLVTSEGLIDFDLGEYNGVIEVVTSIGVKSLR